LLFDTRAGSSVTFPYLALHREEFTWPRLLPATPVSSYLTVSPIASLEAGLFSVALVVIPLTRDARTLSGSLPFGVRTFLFCLHKSDHPTRFTIKA
jgi:hypothetical protein